MRDRARFRMNDMIDAIDQIGMLLRGKTFDDLTTDRPLRAAFERFLEILSEASRHVPESLRANAPEIPWRSVSDIGNYLRHAYHRVDSEILWRLHADGQLPSLRNVIVRFLESPEVPSA